MDTNEPPQIMDIPEHMKPHERIHQVHPLIGIPVVFGGFTLLAFTVVWVVDHIFRWQYELPFRWWI